MIVYQLAHLTRPEATTFFEAGTNLGYTASRVFSLWSPGAGLNAVTLHSHLEKEWRGSNPASTCHDGMPASVPISLLCGGEKPADEALKGVSNSAAAALPESCTETRSEVQFHAFDGAKDFQTNVSDIFSNHFPNADFKYNLGAVMQNHGGWLHFAQRLDEGGHVLAGTTPGGADAATAVPIISVDGYAAEHGLELDMLKVDVEGYDLAVLTGAVKQLERHIWFLQFEWGGQKFKPSVDDPGPGGHNFTTFGEATEALDALGYTCYLMGNRYEPSRTLVQVTGCLGHEPFCQAIGNACQRLAHVPQIKATKLHNNADGWGRYVRLFV